MRLNERNVDVVVDDLQHKLKDLVEHFFRQPTANPGKRRVIRRLVLDGVLEELFELQAIGTPPGDPTLPGHYSWRIHD